MFSFNIHIIYTYVCIKHICVDFLLDSPQNFTAFVYREKVVFETHLIAQR